MYVVSLTVFGVNIHSDPLIQMIGRGESESDCVHDNYQIDYEGMLI